jgi:hypothetical protein
MVSGGCGVVWARATPSESTIEARRRRKSAEENRYANMMPHLDREMELLHIVPGEATQL